MRITGCNFIPRLWFSVPGSAFLTLLLAINFFHGLGNSQSYGEKRDEEAVIHLYTLKYVPREIRQFWRDEAHAQH